jgi:hypothetical protein
MGFQQLVEPGWLEKELRSSYVHQFHAQGACRAEAPGRAAIAELVPDAGRVTPPTAAAFSLMMLATTPTGDAYT